MGAESLKRKTQRLTAAAVIIRLMEEKFQEKAEIISMAVAEKTMMALGSSFLGIFCIITAAAARINTPAPIGLP